jgi:alkanesulfonate monooxygenase SsuD/methylene tetrahydromethanopterin reductase-like flavin-dependent oxidoreductase (luciferase family)
MTAMAAIAARTTRLKFGPSVFVTPFRNPVLMAREIAMVDYLSNGRILPAFGIGAEQEREFLAAGVPFQGARAAAPTRPSRSCGSAGPK